MDEMQLALDELNQGTQEAQGEAAETAEQKEQVELLEILAGEQEYKIPLNANARVKHNGAIQETPIEKMLNAYRQSAHVEDKFKELNDKRSAFEKERGEYEAFNQMKEKYGKIQDWSEANPTEWEALWDMFQNRNQVLGQTAQEGQTPINPEVLALKEELAELKNWKGQFESQQQDLATQEDVKAIESEIASFKEQYPDIDLAEKDLDGVSLQGLIIKHGLDNGHKDFTSSALTYPGLMARLLESAQKKGRNEAVKSVRQDKADGVVARSSKPFGQGSAIDPRRLGESERDEAALSELQGLLSQ